MSLELGAQQGKGQLARPEPEEENLPLIADLVELTETYLSVEESQTRISSWWRRWGGGRAAGRGEMSSLEPAARVTAIISLRAERGVTGRGGTV